MLRIETFPHDFFHFYLTVSCSGLLALESIA